MLDDELICVFIEGKDRAIVSHPDIISWVYKELDIVETMEQLLDVTSIFLIVNNNANFFTRLKCSG